MIAFHTIPKPFASRSLCTLAIYGDPRTPLVRHPSQPVATLQQLLVNIEVVKHEGVVVRAPVFEGPDSEVGDDVAEWDVEAELKLDRAPGVEVTADELMLLMFEMLDDIVVLNTGVEEVNGVSRILILTEMTLEEGDFVRWLQPLTYCESI